ncbi:MAG: glucose-6-phosphate isomerase [Pseudomonadota bacterium]
MMNFSSHISRLKTANLKTLISAEGNDRVISATGWHADLARHYVDQDMQSALLKFAIDSNVTEAINALFDGERVNPSEDRPALHWALRAQGHLPPFAEEVRSSLTSGDVFADDVNAGRVRASNGEPFRNIVHIGIGGSDFGPRLIADTFEMERNRDLTLRFCANLDPIDLDLALDGLDPSETLVIGVSKSFGTEETIYNLTRARDWLRETLQEKTPDHLALVTSRKDRAMAWLGGADVRTFDMAESIGGRFSLWSNASIACRIALGGDIINGIRMGAADMDTHFKDAPLDQNLPVRLALLDYWNRSCLGFPMRVVLAYARRLRLLPTYLQQLEMESNGKSMSPDGSVAPMVTAPAVWGGEGSVGQHSYHQWLHQGPDKIPTEFILAPDADSDEDGRRALAAHALAQAEVLANGRSFDEVITDEPELAESVAHQKVHEGGRPSSFLYTDDFGPRAFGALIALFEHRTYIAGKLWQINSFDQWGVERGKAMAGQIKEQLSEHDEPEDLVTARLANLIQKQFR